MNGARPESGSRAVGLLVCLAATLLAPSTVLAGPPEGQASSGVLYLTDGGVLPGEPADSAEAGVLRWQSPAFTSPFDFSLDAAAGVRWPAATPVAPDGEFRVELLGGDTLYGSLVELDDDGLVVDAPRLGRLSVDRRRVREIGRRTAGGPIYVGPNGLSEWKSSGADEGWREEAGVLTSDQPGASIFGDLGLPAKASIEFEIGWKEKPDFALALGVDSGEASLKHAFRLEVWDGRLVVLRESDREADVAPIGPVDRGPSRIRLRVELDQERGRVVVFGEQGERLAELDLPDAQRQVLGGIRLTNLGGALRLERLRIGPGEEGSPGVPAGGGTFVRRTDGSLVSGQVTSYDAEKGELVIRTDSGETRIARDQLRQVRLSTGTGLPSRRQVRVLCTDGVCLSGDLVKVEQGRLCLKVPELEEPARLPLDRLRSLAVQVHRAQPLLDTTLLGTLLVEGDPPGVRLRGRLVEGRERPGVSCLVWEPVGSEISAALRPGLAGEILYKDPRLVRRTPSSSNISRGQRIVVTPARTVLPPLVTASEPEDRHVLHLRTGDTIPAEVVRIDESGVTIRSEATKTTRIPLSKVQAVELANVASNPVRLSKPKRERLLTLPRMQKEDPPTHVVRSRSGDFLRGRVVSLDEFWLQVEVRLETRKLPRDRIARIMWLHPEDVATAGPMAPKPGPTRVQAVRPDGSRLTFAPDHYQAGVLSGTSDIVGPCRVELEKVDRLILGSAIEESAASLLNQRWVLHDAPEPKGADEGAEAGRPSGTGSALVGQPAPDFTLDLLDGKSFHLADAKGRVVVLDFWATWCGPCLQTMPQVERVTREFAEKDVRLVAVNLQEAPKEIATTLERHKLAMTVALDVDGAVAGKYQATAIPQTVIIDRDGKIARLFVGGGSRFDERLREALRSVLDPAKAGN